VVAARGRWPWLPVPRGDAGTRRAGRSEAGVTTITFLFLVVRFFLPSGSGCTNIYDTPFKSRLADGQPGRGSRLHGDPSIRWQAGRRHSAVNPAHPTVWTRPRRLPIFSWVPRRGPLSSLSTTHPSTPLPRKRRNRTPTHFPPRLHFLGTSEHARRGRQGENQQTAPAPPPFPAADRRRSELPARGVADRGPGGRCVRTFLAAILAFLSCCLGAVR
jgi:hypothetical protein